MYQLLVSPTAVGAVFQVLPITIFAGLIYILIHILTQRKGTEHTGLYFTIVNGLLVCYVVALVSLLLSPRNFWVYIWFYVFNGYPGCTIGPFLQPYFNFVPNIIQCILGNLELNLTLLEAFFANFMLFVPMGVFTRLKQNKMSPALIVVPITIELLQPIIGRSFDIDDIIAYTCGGLLPSLRLRTVISRQRITPCASVPIRARFAVINGAFSPK